jgi:hypothetical protein
MIGLGLSATSLFLFWRPVERQANQTVHGVPFQPLRRGADTDVKVVVSAPKRTQPKRYFSLVALAIDEPVDMAVPRDEIPVRR